MRDDVAHVILTRFNLPSSGAEGYVRASSGWLEQRWQLFAQYCLPSVSGQTSSEFTWIVYLDPESPKWLKDEIARVASSGLLVPVFRAAVERSELLDDIEKAVGERHATLVTTNLDNDDALAFDFIERVQAAAMSVIDRSAIYLSVGLIKADRRLYRRVDRSNPFCSVREDWVSPVTCWADWHTLLGRSMPVVEIGGRPGWMQVIHGNNVSNRVRGLLVSPIGHEAAFGTALDDIALPRRSDLIRDRVIDLPLRTLRETARRSIKIAVMTVGGKTGLNRVKEFRQAWRGRDS